MIKKKYKRPFTKVISVDVNTILAGSTNATGEDIPWAKAKELNQLEDFSLHDEEELINL